MNRIQHRENERLTIPPVSLYYYLIGQHKMTLHAQWQHLDSLIATWWEGDLHTAQERQRRIRCGVQEHTARLPVIFCIIGAAKVVTHFAVSFANNRT